MFLPPVDNGPHGAYRNVYVLRNVSLTSAIAVLLFYLVAKRELFAYTDREMFPV